jgi:hypothetical protein
MRLLTTLPEGGIGGVRFLYVSPRGAHGFGPSDPEKVFNVDLYGINSIGFYFRANGTDWRDHTCLADDTCPFIPTLP